MTSNSSLVRSARPAIAVFMALVATGIAWSSRSSDKNTARPTPVGRSVGLPPLLLTSSTVQAPSATFAATMVATTVKAPPLQHAIRRGMAGEDVRQAQQRLLDLAFDPGPVDGSFGSYTEQAVWAFEKLVLGREATDATGVIDETVWAALWESNPIRPRRTGLSRTHVEIYLPEQVLVVFTDDAPVLIAHVSSGSLAAPGDDFTKGAEWCEEVQISPGERGNEDGIEVRKDGRCGNAETPGGTYRFYRKVDGIRDSALGSMYDPVYFNYGIAVHGALEIPLTPASHGCVRVNRYLGARFAALIQNASGTESHPEGDDVYVWNGEAEPEAYGARPGWFDWDWAEWHEINDSTTTSSTPTSSTTAVSSASGPPSPIIPDPSLPPTATTTAADPPALGG